MFRRCASYRHKHSVVLGDGGKHVKVQFTFTCDTVSGPSPGHMEGDIKGHLRSMLVYLHVSSVCVCGGKAVVSTGVRGAVCVSTGCVCV